MKSEQQTTDLALPAGMDDAFPGLADRLRRAAELFQGIRTWEDVERHLIRGQGLARGTYQAYSRAVRAFYDFTDNLNPLQVVPADVEAWHSSMAALKPATRALRIAALRNFYGGLERLLPGYASPFSRMPDALKERLRERRDETAKLAMNATEIRSTLAHLAARDGAAARIDEAMVLTLLTTGLRASELCALSWSDLWRDADDGRWWITGTGKGAKPYRLELHPRAVRAIRWAWRETHARRHKPEDPLITNARGGRLNRQYVWDHLRRVGEELKATGAIRKRLEFSPHLFRRSFLTLLLKRGMDVKSVQAISRHADAKTLLTHYIDGSESPAAILDGVLKGAA